MSIILRTRIQLFHSDPSKIGDLVVDVAFTTSGASSIAKPEEVGVFWSAAPARLALYKVLLVLRQVNERSLRNHSSRSWNLRSYRDPAGHEENQGRAADKG